MKVYRDWQISGDDAWLQRMYPLARASLDYCIATWDPDAARRALRAAPQHLRHRVLGPGRHVLQLLHRRPVAPWPLIAQALGKATRRATRSSPKGAVPRETLQRRVLRAEDAVGGPRRQTHSPWKIAVLPTQSRSEVAEAVEKRRAPSTSTARAASPTASSARGWPTLFGIPDTDRPRKKREGATSRPSFNTTSRKTSRARQSRNVPPTPWERGRPPALLLAARRQTLAPFSTRTRSGPASSTRSLRTCIVEGLVDEGSRIVQGAAATASKARCATRGTSTNAAAATPAPMASYALLGALSGFRYSAVERCLWFAPRQSARPFRCFFSTADRLGHRSRSTTKRLTRQRSTKASSRSRRSSSEAANSRSPSSKAPR